MLPLRTILIWGESAGMTGLWGGILDILNARNAYHSHSHPCSVTVL